MYNYRAYTGWITDLASRPHPRTAWPAIDLDDVLLEDYEQTFATMQHLGLNTIGAWGFFVAGAWPPDVETAVDDQRSEILRKLIAAGRNRGIKIVSGLGVYSWGFERIIAENPSLSRGNSRVMCPANPVSWDWQRRIVDYVLGYWDLDGVSMQSADQGRCPCDTCARMRSVEYHAALNIRVADYIKSQWPSKVVGVNNWGTTFEHPEDKPHIVELSRHVDYIIDAHDTVSRAGQEYRRDLIPNVACDWGTIGGYAVEPPQHWNRERWFLPCLERAAPYIARAYADGARACELYFRILENPGDEISFHCCARTIANPTGDWRTYLAEAIQEIYTPRDEATARALADVFLQAEAAYFESTREMPRVGTISLEPLVSDHAGEPIYLTRYLDPASMARYGAELLKVQSQARALMGSVGAPGRIAKIVRCIDGVMQDIDYARSRTSSVKSLRPPSQE